MGGEGIEIGTEIGVGSKEGIGEGRDPRKGIGKEKETGVLLDEEKGIGMGIEMGIGIGIEREKEIEEVDMEGREKRGEKEGTILAQGLVLEGEEGEIKGERDESNNLRVFVDIPCRMW